MNPQQRLLLSAVLLSLAIGAGIVLLLTPKSVSVKSLLEAEKKKHLHALDSMVRVNKILVERDSGWARVNRADRDELRRAHDQTTKWQAKYENAKRTPVIRYTEHQLDSVVDAVLVRYGHIR